VALLHKDSTGGYGVSFPDFPGCISAGDTWESGVDNAVQALRFHTEGMIADGQTVPDPRSLDELRQDPESAEDFRDAVVTLIPLLPPRGKQERVNVSLDGNLLREIDKAADAQGLTRSSFLAEGARLLLGIGSPSEPHGPHGAIFPIASLTSDMLKAALSGTSYELGHVSLSHGPLVGTLVVGSAPTSMEEPSKFANLVASGRQGVIGSVRPAAFFPVDDLAASSRAEGIGGKSRAKAPRRKPKHSKDRS
jgi:predicted RNase H-like HicB family nuclease